jgi:hypothetical protein
MCDTCRLNADLIHTATASDVVEPHLVPTSHKLLRMPVIPGTHPGGVVSVRESADVTPCVRIFVAVPEDADVPDGPRDSADVQLSVEDALRLADQLVFLARNHRRLRSGDPVRSPATSRSETVRFGCELAELVEVCPECERANAELEVEACTNSWHFGDRM